VSKTIEIKQARPSELELNLVAEFLGQLDYVMDCDEHPHTGDHLDERAKLLFLATIYRQVDRCLQRVYWAGRCALDNCTDTESDVVEWRPEIRELFKFARAQNGGQLPNPNDHIGLGI
jgi:hypothetical protein